jgi:hypothetical protein
LTEQQTVRDTAQATQALDSFVHQGDAGIAADFADARVAVRIDVEKRVAGVAARKYFSFPEMLHRLRRQGLSAAIDRRDHEDYSKLF